MDSPETRMARLEVLLETTLNQVKGLKEDMERFMDKLSSLQLVEERNRRLEQDLRSLESKCQSVREDLDSYRKEQQLTNDKFNRYIYIISGIVLACSIAWGVVGSYVSSSFSKMMVLVAEHSHESHTQKPSSTALTDPSPK